MTGPLDALKLTAGAALGAALMAVPAYLKGKSVAEAETRTAALEKTLEIIKSRDAVDAQVSVSGAAGLCGLLGVRPEDLAECVRRVEKADTVSGVGSHDRTD